MKQKRLFLMLGMAAMLASCGQDELGGTRTDGLATITATIDDGMGTRASTFDKDDVAIDQCLLEVYDAAGSTLVAEAEGVQAGQGGTFTFTVGGLDPETEYDFLFWADNREAAAYTGTLKERKLADGADLSKALAFQGKIEGATVEEATSATLTHAVAKVTLKTTGALAAGDKATLSMAGVADTWDVLGGTATGDATAEYAYTLASAIAQAQDGAEVTTFYVPAPVLGSTSDMTVGYASADGSKAGSANVTNVPLKANYRTVLKGDVAALYEGATASITAQLNSQWSDPDSEVEFPQTNIIETTGVGQITSEAVIKAAEIGNGTVVIKGQISKADLDVIAKITDTKINLDLSQATLMNEEGTQAITEFPASFQYNTFTRNESVLTGIILPSGIESLAVNCFLNSVNMTSVTLPEGLKTIGNTAFDKCQKLNGISLEGVEAIGQFAFRASGLSGKLVVPSSVKSAGQGCFTNTKITSVEWNSDCRVADQAFNMCANLTSITLNTDAELGIAIANYIGEGTGATPAFNLTCNSLTPPAMTNKTFQYSTIKNIYVPEEALEAYTVDNLMWATYADIIKPIQ